MSPLLEVSDLTVTYGRVPAVKNLSIDVDEGDLRIILGANGAGKSTTIRSIMGVTRARSGSVRVSGTEVRTWAPHRISRLGVSWLPEGRQLWGSLTVRENVQMGAFGTRDRAAAAKRLDELFERFPILAQRGNQLAASLSGGEQQIVALARALVAGPRLILMDEPSLGLAPLAVKTLFDVIRTVHESGVTILMVEQNARQALKIATYGYLLEEGEIRAEGTAKSLAETSAIADVFLGGRRRE